MAFVRGFHPPKTILTIPQLAGNRLVRTRLSRPRSKMALSMSAYSGAAAEHNYSPVAERPPPSPVVMAEPAPPGAVPQIGVSRLPHAHPAVTRVACVLAAKVAMVVPIRTKKLITPESKPAAEPRQWTGLSAQLASDYQHDDEHAPNSPMRQCAPSAPPPVSQAVAAAVQPAYPMQLPAGQLRSKPKVTSPQLRPAASPFGPNPNQQWAGLSAAMADEFPHAEAVEDDDERDKGRRVRSVQPGLSPSTTPTAPPIDAIGPPGQSPVPRSPARAGLAAAEPLSPSFRATPAGLEPVQWLGLSQDPSSTLHNMAPSPENSRQRQRRLSREIEREVAAVKLAEEENRAAG